MTTIRPASLLAGTAALLLSTFASAQVASPKIIINNVSPAAEIGLQSASTIEFLANGDLRINCRLVSGQCDTANIGGGGSSGTNPPTNVTLTASTTSLTAGGAFSLTWSSTNAEACFAVGPAGIANWSGQVLATTRSSPGLSLSLAEGSYVFQIRCYNAGGSTTASSAQVTVTQGGGGPGPSDYCGEYYDGTTRPVPTAPNFTAHGHEKVEQPFEQVWPGVQIGLAGERRAVPGVFVIPAQNRYLAVPFTMTSSTGSLSQFRFSWVEAAGLEGVVSGSVTVTVSPCPGDFRPSQTGSSDAYLSAQCRRSYGIMGEIAVTSDSTLSGCPAPINKKMYLNISTHNMYNATAGSSSCSGQTCGVSMRLLD